jgi:hypothetical protein
MATRTTRNVNDAIDNIYEELNSNGGGSKIYKALLTQSGDTAPTVSVLENTLGGTVVWTRQSAGTYVGTLSGAFTANKTACFTGTTYGATYGGTDFNVNNVNTVYLYTFDHVDMMTKDGYLNNTLVVIEIFE